jgi:histidyl-tRNA synthetase
MGELSRPIAALERESRTFNLEVIGMSKPIAEAVAIETAYVILKERYPDEELMLEVNSIGDKESMARFARELQNYCRKESGGLPAVLKAEIKKDMFSIFTMEDERAQEFIDNAPKPMAFLSDPSRNHFKEVLEYLESLDIPYEINHKLIAAQRIASLRLVGCIVEHAIIARMLDVIHDEIIVRVCESHDFL